MRTGPPRSTAPYPQLSMTSRLGGRVMLYGTTSEFFVEVELIRLSMKVVMPPFGRRHRPHEEDARAIAARDNGGITTD